MLGQVKKTELILGLALGAIVGVLVGAALVTALYLAHPDLFEPLLARPVVIPR